jgi:hypothetical protein
VSVPCGSPKPEFIMPRQTKPTVGPDFDAFDDAVCF